MTSYTCKCGLQNEFAPYVFAHWNVQIVHSCDCGRKNCILRGRIVKWGKVENEKQKLEVRKLPEANPIS
jgi:hypothetical protein